MRERCYLRLAGGRRHGGSRAAHPSNFPTHLPIRVGGKSKKVPVAYFWKDAISVGKYTHPATGQRLKVTPERIDSWVDNFNAMRRRGIEIPAPVDHSDRAEDNRGFVVAMKRNGDTLQLLHQMIGEKGALLAARNRCSVCIEPNFVDEKGREWGESIVHSALTPKPVVSGHGAFRSFAASQVRPAQKLPVFYSQIEAQTMSTLAPELTKRELKEARKILGLGAKAKITTTMALRAMLDRRGGKSKRRELEDDDLLIDDIDQKEKDDEDDDDVDDADEEGGDDADDDEETDDKAESSGRRKAGPAQRLAASRARAISPTESMLLSRVAKTEREAVIASGNIDPATMDAIDELFMDGGQFKPIALSRVEGSDDSLYFELLQILKNAKPVPLRERSPGQSRTAMNRMSPGGEGGDDPKDLERLRKETLAFAAQMNGHRVNGVSK